MSPIAQDCRVVTGTFNRDTEFRLLRGGQSPNQQGELNKRGLQKRKR